MESDQNKSEKPTPYKLKQARDKGQVSKSTEFNAVFVMAFMLTISYILYHDWFESFKLLARKTILSAGQVSSEPVHLFSFLSTKTGDFYMVIFPLLLLLILFTIVSNIFQIGFIFTTHTIKPDFNKLNPAKNLKNIFAKKTLFELFKAILKILFFSAFIFFVKDTVVDQLLRITISSPAYIDQIWASIFFKLAMWMLLLLITIALLDYAYNKWNFSKQMMMSMHEVKDEHKKREGDPEIKSKRKQAQKELLEKANALSNVKNADIIVTNPTHIAVALQYDLKDMVAPKVLAMGRGELAGKIRTQGRRHQIPTIQNIPVARLLYKECTLNNYIPLTCFDKVAPIFRWLFAMREQSIHE